MPKNGKRDLSKWQNVRSKKLNSKSFWYAFDKIVSEKPMKEEKAARGDGPRDKIDIDELDEILDESTEAIVATHKKAYEIEEGFRPLKDRDRVSCYPMYHWTDSKIRGHAFVCVLALLLLKMLVYVAKQNGLEMSSKLLIEELEDIRMVILIYPNPANGGVSRLSKVQARIYDLFGLDKYT